MSLATASNWFWNWVIAFVVPYIVDNGEGNLGPKISFIWFATSLCAFVWTYFFVPETKGLSLEDLDEMFEEKLPARLTPGWQPTGIARGGLHPVVSDHEQKDILGSPGTHHDFNEKTQVEEVAHPVSD